MDLNIKHEPDDDVPVNNPTCDSDVTSFNITVDMVKIDTEGTVSGLIGEEQIDLPDSCNDTSDVVRGSRTILESEETNSTMDMNINHEPDDDVPVNNPTCDSDVTSFNITVDMIKIDTEEAVSGIIREEQIDLPDSCNDTSDVVRGSRTTLESEETNSTMDMNINHEQDDDIPVSNPTCDSDVTSFNITDDMFKIETEGVQFRPVSGLIREEQIDLPVSCNDISDDVTGSRTILESEETNSTMDMNINHESDDDVPVDNPTCDSDVTSVNVMDDMFNIETEEVQFRSDIKQLITIANKDEVKKTAIVQQKKYSIDINSDTKLKKNAFVRLQKTFIAVCEYCGQNFFIKQVLQKHIMSVHGCLLFLQKDKCFIDIKSDTKLKKNVIVRLQQIFIAVCEYCGQNFFIKQVLQRHIMSVHGGLLLLQKDKCFIDIKSDTKLKKNVIVRLQQIFIAVCEYCGQHFHLKQVLQKHIMSVHGCLLFSTKHAKLTCKVQNHEIRSPQVLNNHILSHHHKEIVKVEEKCDVCSKCFTSKGYLEYHMRLHTGEKPFKCDFCIKCFARKNHLKEHLRLHMGQKQFKCDACNKCFMHSKSLKKHMKSHTGEKLFKCDVCNKCFMHSDGLKRHMKLHTSEKPFKCDLCNKCFRENSNLKKHMKVHTGEKPFKCDFCNKCFMENYSLTYHMRLHTGEKRFKCDVCNKCFTQSIILKNHKKIHSVEKPFKCDVCNKGFTSSCTFKYHMRLHTGEKPFNCDVCKKCFIQSSHLKNHLKIHTGEKPFKCDVCNKCFTDNCKLKYHMRLHTGEKPFKCDHCNKCFTLSGSLKSHIRIHTGEKPYKCDVCNKCFTQRCNLKKHKRLHTGKKPLKRD